MAFLGSSIQVVTAIALVIILGVVAFLVYNAEMLKAIRESGKVRREVPIFVGIKDLAISKNETYSTLDTTDPMYRNLDNSVNQKAGAEYTYNFWLYMRNPPARAATETSDEIKTDVGLTAWKSKNEFQSDETSSNKPFVLLLRGDDRAVPYKSQCYVEGNDRMKVDVLVKQPMIKLDRGYDVLTVELNTQAKPDGVKEKSRDTCASSENNWSILNSYRIGVTGVREKMNDKWNMVTVVVQDTFPSDPLPIRNKVRVRVYINGTLEVDRYVDGKLAETSSKASLLRPNQGNLYVAPTIKASLNPTNISTTTSLSAELGPNQKNTLLMANLTYFNYALDDVQIKSLFSANFAKKYAITVGEQPVVPQALKADTGEAYDSAYYTAI